jgi:hypothetical protein
MKLRGVPYAVATDSLPARGFDRFRGDRNDADGPDVEER